MRSITPKKLVLIIIALILLPALLFTANEFSSLSSSEQMIAEIYNRQLDAVLFSVNQYAWDVANTWASSIDLSIGNERNIDLNVSLRSMLEKNRALKGIFISDSTLGKMSYYSMEENISQTRLRLTETLRTEKTLIARLKKFKKSGYRKLEPVLLSKPLEQDDVFITLVFIPYSAKEEIKFVGMLLDTREFLLSVISPKLREIAGDEFVLGIFEQNVRQPVYTTQAFSLDEIVQKKSIWLFPEHYLGIRLKGQTIEELSRNRFYRNLLLVAILDLLLLTAIWIVYKNIVREIELARMKSDFVSNVSHELKTPLALIRMFSETLELDRVPSEEKKHEYYRVISQETERLTHLVNNILNFSRMEAGRKEYHFQNIDVNEIVKEVLHKYRYHLRQHDFQVRTNLSEKLPSIEADRESISEALLNLIDNAIKYSRDKKYVAVTTGIENGSVFLEVEDKGVGIDLKEREKIFEKFYRVSDGLIHNTKGSGLGLALVKNIMDAHGGKIILDSRVGEGSQFRLYLPLKTISAKKKVATPMDGNS